MISDKWTMYDLLTAGVLGNTIPQYATVDELRNSGDHLRYKYWGVRTKTPGGPCRLNCPVDELESTIRAFSPHPTNISVMIDQIVQVTLWAEVYDIPGGLGVYGIEYPPKGGSWRDGMPYAAWQENRGHWEGTAARLLLQKHLNPNSLADLYDLIERYPDHQYEFSATGTCFGTLAHRNTIIWEVRRY